MNPKDKMKMIGAVAAGSVMFLAIPTVVFASTFTTENSADLSVLDRVSNEQDSLLSVVFENLGSQLQSETSRRISNGTQSSWVVLNNEQEICLVISESEENGAVTCASPERFNSHGIGLQTWSVGLEPAEYYVVPDSVASESNLIAVSASSTSKAKDILSRVDSDAAESVGFEPMVLPYFDPKDIKAME